jgi:hypothetical protein
MTANSPARLSMQHMLPPGTRTAWVKVVDPESEEALMTVSMHPLIEETLEEEAAVAAEAVPPAAPRAPEAQPWFGEFGVTRSGPVSLLLYASGDAGPKLEDDMGLIDQHDGQIYFESEFFGDIDEGAGEEKGPGEGGPPEERPAEEKPMVSVVGGQEAEGEVHHEGWGRTLREVFD